MVIQLQRCFYFGVALSFFALAASAADAPAKPVEAPAETPAPADPDAMRAMQLEAIEKNRASWGHWGPTSETYLGWSTHSNRLIPVYSFGMKLDSVSGKNSIYRDEKRLTELYGRLPTDTFNPDAEYFDQTDVYHLQAQAAKAGKKRIILMIYDGMDWQSTQAAAIYNAGRVAYNEGRGTGLSFLDYRGAETDYGYFVTSPHNNGTQYDPDAQGVKNPGGQKAGGYDWKRAGVTPWGIPPDILYPISKNRESPHPYTDSSASATSLMAGIKTYNDAVNVDANGKQVETIAHKLQKEGYAIGVVTSVPISHATPACAYAHNVSRDDTQDITRDLLGQRSVSHRDSPLPGVDVLLGAGFGDLREKDAGQGQNFIPGPKYGAIEDIKRAEARNGGKYEVVVRKPGVSGKEALSKAARFAMDNRRRLFGVFGGAHLPFRTADGDWTPTKGNLKIEEKYSGDDRKESPELADFAVAALDVLSSRSEKFWMMIEAGEVDWANHDNNLDNSIGATISGANAFTAMTDWIEHHGGWNDTVLLLTADHAHYFFLTEPEAIAEAGAKRKAEGRIRRDAFFISPR